MKRAPSTTLDISTVPMHHDGQDRIFYQGDFEKYRGQQLPHWEVDDGIYFVTFRLGDSIPRTKQRRLSEAYERRSRELVDDPDAGPEDVADFALEFFRTRVDGVLDDGGGACHLEEPQVAEMVQNSLQYFDGERYDLLAWSIMPNHAHVVFQKSPEVSLAEVVGSWKSYTAHRAREFVDFGDHFWQSDYYDRLVRTKGELRDSMQYVWSNPERAELEDWEWKGLCWPE